jgi:hypothetical protein
MGYEKRSNNWFTIQKLKMINKDIQITEIVNQIEIILV